MKDADPMKEKRQCTATNRRGERCGRAPIRGGNVCRLHGGAAPQVRRKAELRLLGLVDPAIAELTKLLKQARNEGVRLGAIKDILDRNGFKPAERHEHAGLECGPITVVLSTDEAKF